MKLHFMLNRRNPGAANSVLGNLIERLSARGHSVTSNISEEILTQPDQLALEHDLVILKSHTELSLSVASILHDRGARLLNPYPACGAVQDKIFGVHRLRAAGIPVPRTWITNDARLLHSLIQEHPLLVKPAHGFGGAGVRIIHRPADLKTLPVAPRPNLIQEYIEGTGTDLKVYTVGDRVFAVRKPFAADSSTQAGVPVPVTQQVQDITLRCGQVFGLGVFGVDIIESPTGPVVVDVNYFPGFKGIHEIDLVLADYIEAYARGRVDLAFPSYPSRQETVEHHEPLLGLR